jgi:hypothetical protein
MFYVVYNVLTDVIVSFWEGSQMPSLVLETPHKDKYISSWQYMYTMYTSRVSYFARDQGMYSSALVKYLLA